MLCQLVTIYWVEKNSVFFLLFNLLFPYLLRNFCSANGVKIKSIVFACLYTVRAGIPS